LREAGIRVIATATTVAEAVDLERAGVDAVIAQGWEAGGHRGSLRLTLPGEGVGTMALVPQVVDAVRVPVIAAGGIGDGRGIAAAFTLGASGVQMGTAFLSCPEAATDPERRALLARAGDTDTMVTDAYSGRPARAVVSRYALEMADLAGQMAPYPQMYDFSEPLVAAAAGAGEEAFASFHLYGQAAALNRAMPAGELVGRLVAEAMARLGPR
jgi:nitronate monooxygenase